MDKYNHWVYKDDLCKLITSKSWLITMTTIELDSCLEKNANNNPPPHPPRKKNGKTKE